MSQFINSSISLIERTVFLVGKERYNLELT